MIIVVGSGLVAVCAAHRLLEAGHDVALTTAHAEFGFPHGGCGLWNTDVLPWPLATLEEAVAAATGSRVACRSQWLVKRLVHRFTDAGGSTSTRVRLKHDAESWSSLGTGMLPLDDIHHVLVADQDVPEPTSSDGTALFSFVNPVHWYGAVVVDGSSPEFDHAGVRADGSVEVWSKVEQHLAPVQRTSLETLQMVWEDDGHALDAARCMQRAHEAVDDFLMSNRLATA
ncbi:MAG: hypothetical protein CMB11_00120 [Euryarchaeota archaeon]|nr:hypothetical protein [Euryarchaeota archaeon]